MKCIIFTLLHPRGTETLPFSRSVPMLNENSDWPWLGHIPAAPPPPPAWGRAEPWLEQGRGNFTKRKLLSKEEKRNAGQAKIMRIPTLPNNHLHLDQRQERKDCVYVFLGPRFYCKWQFHGPPPPILLPNVHILPSLPALIQMPPRLQDFTSFHQIKSNQPTHSYQALQCSSIHSLSHVWLCDPMDCSTPDFPVHHQLPELAHIHVHQVSDTIQPSHPLSSPSPLAFNLFQHQDLF